MAGNHLRIEAWTKWLLSCRSHTKTCGINVSPTCGKILSHVVTRPTRSAHDSFTFCERCTRLENVVTRSDSFSHARERKKNENAQKFFRRPACEPRVSGHIVARPRYVRRAPGYASNKFLGSSSLVTHTVDIRTQAKVITSIIKCGIKLLIHSQTVACIMFSRRFHSAYECVQSLGMVTIIHKYWIWNDFHIGI